MIVLVRCHDSSFAPALESRLDDLVGKGLIAGFLKNGEWVEVDCRQGKEQIDLPHEKRPSRTYMAACY